MSTELHISHDSLAGFTLGVSTLLMLEKKGILLDRETIEIVDQALGILQNHKPDRTVRAEDAWELAHELLTKLRAFLSSADYRDKHINF